MRNDKERRGTIEGSDEVIRGANLPGSISDGIRQSPNEGLPGDPIIRVRGGGGLAALLLPYFLIFPFPHP